MYTTILLIFLFNAKVWCQDYFDDTPLLKEDYEMNLKDIGIRTNNKVTKKDILHLLKVFNKSKEQTIQRTINPEQYCRSFDTCHKCVNSISYPCNWCHNLGCTDRGDQLCPLPTRKSLTVSWNQYSCPFIYNKTDMLVASGVRKHIEVRINIPDPALRTNDIVCQIKLRNGMTHVKGIIVKNKVFCFPLKLTIKDGSEVGKFSILWGGVESNSNEIPMVIYRCDALAYNCEGCRTLPSEYSCGWCEHLQFCVMSDKCDDVLSWSLNKLTCQFETKKMFFV